MNSIGVVVKKLLPASTMRIDKRKSAGVGEEGGGLGGCHMNQLRAGEFSATRRKKKENGNSPRQTLRYGCSYQNCGSRIAELVGPKKKKKKKKGSRGQTNSVAKILGLHRIKTRKTPGALPTKNRKGQREGGDGGKRITNTGNPA